MPTTGALAAGATQPKIRLRGPDPTPAPSRLTLPSPEELGLVRHSAPAPTQASQTLDWNQAHARLQQLGAVGFHIDRLPAGNVRVSFLLPTSDPQRTHHVEAEAAHEGQAVYAALEQAETWTRSKR